MIIASSRERIPTIPSYAGTLLTQPTLECAAYVAQHCSLADVIQFTPMQAMNQLVPVMPYPDQRQRPIKLGGLFWPQGASRWAVGHFLATETQLTAIRAICYPYTTPQTLVIADGLTTLSPAMWMLPPRPLSQNPPDTASLTKWLLPKEFNPTGEAIYLLTLVDDRFFWWQRQLVTVTLTVGSTTYSQLMQAIATDLGITITLDTIDAGYLKPPAGLVPYLCYLPLLLDLCAFGVGQRVIRGLDGTVTTQAASTAQTAMESMLSANIAQRLGGGIFSLNAA